MDSHVSVQSDHNCSTGDSPHTNRSPESKVEISTEQKLSGLNYHIEDTVLLQDLAISQAYLSDESVDSIHHIFSPGKGPKVTATFWQSEETICFQVEFNGIRVARREDTNMINFTALLRVAQVPRSRRDAILKHERVANIIKIGPTHLQGVWIPYERALKFAKRERLADQLYPLFVHDIDYLWTLKTPLDIAATDLEESRELYAEPEVYQSTAMPSIANAMLHSDSGFSSLPAIKTKRSNSWSSNIFPDSDSADDASDDGFDLEDIGNFDATDEESATSQYSTEINLPVAPHWKTWVINIATAEFQALKASATSDPRVDGTISKIKPRSQSVNSFAACGSNAIICLNNGPEKERENKQSNGCNSGNESSRPEGGAKRTSRDEGDEEPSDRNDKSNGPKRQKTDPNQSIDSEEHRLACPFHKHQPWFFCENRITGKKYKSCASGFKDLQRLKEHFKRGRLHLAPIQCLRCCEEFKNEEALKIHLRRDEACVVLNPRRISPGVTTQHMEEIKERTKGLTSNGDKWKAIFAVLFPGSPIPSPYHEVDIARSAIYQHLTNFVENYRTREIPQIVRATFSASTSRTEENFQQHLVHLTSHFANRFLSEYYMASQGNTNNPTQVSLPQLAGVTHYGGSQQSRSDALCSDRSTLEPDPSASPRTPAQESSAEQSFYPNGIAFPASMLSYNPVPAASSDLHPSITMSIAPQGAIHNFQQPGNQKISGVSNGPAFGTFLEPSNAVVETGNYNPGPTTDDILRSFTFENSAAHGDFNFDSLGGSFGANWNPGPSSQ